MASRTEPARVFTLMRRQAGLTARDAANALGVTPGAISQWESGSLPEQRLWEAARQWARGRKAKSEENPQFLVSYPFLGRRYFLADARGAVYVFGFPEHAGDAAFAVEGLGLEDVVVVPAWQSALLQLKQGGARLHVYEDGPGGDPVSSLRAYVTRLAGEYAARFGSVVDPP